MALLEEHEFTHGVGGATKTFYLAAGPANGPLLIFIHGWPTIAKIWKPQLEAFAALGFRVVAPDMPGWSMHSGYGRSTVTKNAEDYAQEKINQGMVALLEHLGRERAVWIGHDWGCGSVWSFASHYPEKCVGVVGMCVPYRSIELGLDELVKLTDRQIYPESEYPWGPWAYQKFYLEHFEKATAWFESDAASFLRLAYREGDPATHGKPAFTANVMKDGGWVGGIEKPDAQWKHLPVFLDEETYAEIVAAMEKTGFWGADAWYLNHERNRAYTLDKSKNEGHLHMPALFIGANWDAICDVKFSSLAEPMRKYCTNLTESHLDAGHWVAAEKPAETNAVIARWLVEQCKTFWPGYWSTPLTHG